MPPTLVQELSFVNKGPRDRSEWYQEYRARKLEELLTMRPELRHVRVVVFQTVYSTVISDMLECGCTSTDLSDVTLIMTDGAAQQDDPDSSSGYDDEECPCQHMHPRLPQVMTSIKNIGTTAVPARLLKAAKHMLDFMGDYCKGCVGMLDYDMADALEFTTSLQGAASHTGRYSEIPDGLKWYSFEGELMAIVDMTGSGEFCM